MSLSQNFKKFILKEIKNLNYFLLKKFKLFYCEVIFGNCFSISISFLCS